MACMIYDHGGLEFGGYDYYLKELWDRESPVLFMHDDVEARRDDVFDDIASLTAMGIDQAYIFRDLREEEVNGRIHGRAIYCSRKFLDFCLSYICECREATGYKDPHNEGWLSGIGPHNGFWWDRNHDFLHVSGKVPKGLRHYNCGIYHFHGVHVKEAHRRGMKVNRRVHIWDFESARRGRMNYVRREVIEKREEANAIRAS
jgi:hypothetical protein